MSLRGQQSPVHEEIASGKERPRNDRKDSLDFHPKRISLEVKNSVFQNGLAATLVLFLSESCPNY
jgi:hypothetical protein